MKPKKEDEWACLLGSLLKMRENRPTGKGWYTVKELAKKLGTTGHAMKRRTVMLSSSGMVEMFKGTAVVNGRIVNQTWYRVKKPKK